MEKLTLSEKYSLDPYKGWVNTISYDSENMAWKAEINCDGIISSSSWPQLVDDIKRNVAYRVVTMVASDLKVKKVAVLSNKRNRELADARAVSAFILSRKFRMSTTEISRYLNYKSKNHCNAYSAVIRAIETKEIAEKVNSVTETYPSLSLN